MEIPGNTNPKRERGNWGTAPRSRFGLVWVEQLLPFVPRPDQGAGLRFECSAQELKVAFQRSAERGHVGRMHHKIAARF